MDEITFYLEDLKSRFLGIDKSKYYLSYSGGKDSHFLYWFIKEYLHDTKIEIVAVNTRMEHPEIMQRMYKYSDRVLLPEKTIKQVCEQYGMPCFSKNKDIKVRRYQNGSRSEALMKYVNPPKDSKSHFQLSRKASELLLNGKLHKISPYCCTVTKKQTIHKYEKEMYGKTKEQREKVSTSHALLLSVTSFLFMIYQMKCWKQSSKNTILKYRKYTSIYHVQDVWVVLTDIIQATLKKN